MDLTRLSDDELRQTFLKLCDKDRKTWNESEIKLIRLIAVERGRRAAQTATNSPHQKQA